MAARVEDHDLNLLPPADLAGEIERLQEEPHKEHDRHEAFAMVEHAECEPGTVLDELRRGYLWNNILLRAAQVRVAG